MAHQNASSVRSFSFSSPESLRFPPGKTCPAASPARSDLGPCHPAGCCGCVTAGPGPLPRGLRASATAAGARGGRRRSASGPPRQAAARPGLREPPAARGRSPVPGSGPARLSPPPRRRRRHRRREPRPPPAAGPPCPSDARGRGRQRWGRGQRQAPRRRHERPAARVSGAGGVRGRGRAGPFPAALPRRPSLPRRLLRCEGAAAGGPWGRRANGLSPRVLPGSRSRPQPACLE